MHLGKKLIPAWWHDVRGEIAISKQGFNLRCLVFNYPIAASLLLCVGLAAIIVALGNTYIPADGWLVFGGLFIGGIVTFFVMHIIIENTLYDHTPNRKAVARSTFRIWRELNPTLTSRQAARALYATDDTTWWNPARGADAIREALKALAQK